MLKRAAIVVCCALAALVAASTPSPAQDEPPLAVPVVGVSTLVQPGEAPEVAFVESWWGSESSTCSGTLVDASWVLTAAHCVLLDTGTHADQVTVVLGSVDVRADLAGPPPPGVEVHQIDGWVVHGNPRIGPIEWFNDVAMLHLPQPSAITPMELNTDLDLVRPPSKHAILPARFFGFGLHACPPFCDATDGRLRRGDSSIYSDAFVDEAFNDNTFGTPKELSGKELTRNTFLLPNLGIEGGGCFGDSGGPMVVWDGSQWKLAGVNSFIVSASPGVCNGFIGNPDGDLFILHAVADTVGSPLGDWVRSIIGARRWCGGQQATLTGSSSGDIIIGTAADNVIHGGGGRDEVRARAGDDTICGGSAADDLRAGSGADFIDGQKGDDVIEGRGGPDTIEGGAGDDTITGGGSADVIDGQKGRDTISGGKGPDTIDGGAKRDTIDGNGGRDHVRGGSGPDDIDGGRSDDVLRGGSGDDDVSGNRGDDVLRGQRGDDVLDGGPGSDICVGGAGRDIRIRC